MGGQRRADANALVLHALLIAAGFGIVFMVALLVGGPWLFFPHAWLTLFDSDPAMLDAGTQYLQVVGPWYGFFGLGLVLYFASQGAGRLLWPVRANIVRLAVAVAGGCLALQWGGGLAQVFIAQAVALCLYGLVNAAAAVASGAWFGPVGWPLTPALLAKRGLQSSAVESEHHELPSHARDVRPEAPWHLHTHNRLTSLTCGRWGPPCAMGSPPAC